MIKGVLTGALRGAAAGVIYGFLLAGAIFGQDLVGKTTDVVSVPFVVFLGVYAGLIAGAVGLVGGAAFSALLLPVVRRWPWSTRALVVVAGSMFLVAGLVAFPAIPLGGGVEDLGELLTLKVLPAVVAGATAVWHVSALRSAQVGGDGGVGPSGGTGASGGAVGVGGADGLGRSTRMSPESESASTSMPTPRSSSSDR